MQFSHVEVLRSDSLSLAQRQLATPNSAVYERLRKTFLVPVSSVQFGPIISIVAAIKSGPLAAKLLKLVVLNCNTPSELL